ncbi:MULTISPECIES: ABC-2 transporter permease [Paraclostridium]|uniref:ABC-2 transporter permease n=1 Tax=Paraclostridium TaxID=1849822 RepID=UPI001157EC89|nr:MULTISPECIES: ABC-2 transporter permease [Paraclostridium]MBZ6006789.1 ABC-2 transporter permease [Paraclostridium bifermentans]MDU0298265.1 ABC-2 transporter permease [Paraclostridium sp. MRS3W1]TQO59121.1 ABC-2 transporter permease [Paraclostridium bifermentans]
MENIINLTKMSLNNLSSIIKTILIVIIVWIGIAMINQAFFNIIFGMGTYLLLMQVMSYEDTYGIDNLIAKLPVSKNEYVISRYVLGIIISVIFMVLSVLIYSILNSILELDLTLGIFILIGFVTSMLAISVIIPVILKFGINKGRMVITILTVLMVVVPTGIMTSIWDNKEFMYKIMDIAGNIGIPFILIISSILILIISIIISLRVYKSKEIK